ncbi:MAG: glycosyltransferase [Xanthobacteraceae bacterium]|jgi:GT2 family glycosyltransferase
MNDSAAIDVLISSHNPDADRLRATLIALETQTMPKDRYSLLIVDNASSEPFDARGHRLIREERLGLAYGRLAGIKNTMAPLIVFVDDDNAPDSNYLERAKTLMDAHPEVGMAGGRSSPQWDEKAIIPEWLNEFYGPLAVRDLGPEILIESAASPLKYPACAPIGAGMVVRRAALSAWLGSMNAAEVVTGRQGNELASGEDCDMVLHAIKAGWSVAYFPELQLAHLIPSARVTTPYLARLNQGIAKSWVQLLDRHGICPWPAIPGWSAPLRKMRAWLSYSAWNGKANYVRWKGACGHFDGLAANYKKHQTSRQKPNTTLADYERW